MAFMGGVRGKMASAMSGIRGPMSGLMGGVNPKGLLAAGVVGAGVGAMVGGGIQQQRDFWSDRYHPRRQAFSALGGGLIGGGLAAAGAYAMMRRRPMVNITRALG